MSDCPPIDVSDPALYRDDAWAELFARLRRDDPVHFCPESAYGPYWSVTTYDEILAAELDYATYSSSSELGGIQITDAPRGRELANFIRMDPPRHTTQRKPIVPMFTSDSLKNLEATIRMRTAGVLEQLPRGEEFDWVEWVSVDLTTMMLATLFDFPWEDRHLLAYWSDVVVTDVDSPDSPVGSHEERDAVMAEMGEVFAGMWAERARKAPGFDLISMLAHGAGTRDMAGREFIGNMGLLIVGGNDTTRNSMSGGILAFDEYPDEWRKLRANPGLVDTLVPELVRWQTPVIHMRRTTRTPTQLGGKHIPADAKVVLWYISGNRDGQAIAEPDRFRIDRRRARRHLAFGAGVHRCVGLRLAELQLRILWEEIVRLDLQIEVAGPPRRLHSNFIRGIRSLPVRITR